MSSSTPPSHILIQAHRGQVGMSSPSPTAWRCIYSQGKPFPNVHKDPEQTPWDLPTPVSQPILAEPPPQNRSLRPGLSIPTASALCSIISHMGGSRLLHLGLTLIIQPSHQHHGMKSTLMPLPLLKPFTLKAKPIEAGQIKAHSKAPPFPAASAPTLPPTCSC